MSRRATAQRILDERAFPIRVRVKVPADRFCDELRRVLSWLNDEIGSAGFAYHSVGALGCDALAFYFRDIEQARAFLSAFPDLELACSTIPHESNNVAW